MIFLRSSALALLLCTPLTAAMAQTSALPEAVRAHISAGDYAAARSALAPLAEDPQATEAQYQLALLLLEGRGGAVDRAGGYDLLARAGEAGHVRAAVLLARSYLTGPRAGLTRDPARAAALLQIAVAASDPAAQYYLALLTGQGDGVPRDPAAARSLMVQAAEGGFVEAQYSLSQLYANGGDGIEPDPEVALRWLEAAAEGGKAEAQYFLATALDTGQGTAQDKSAALRWYRRAAEQGLPIAQRTLGTAFLTGTQATDPNPAEALRWLTAAAGAGDPGAMFNLALAYGGDQGIARNDVEALRWLEAASEAGLARASYAFAQYVEAGRGIEADISAAAALYRTAYEQGDRRGAVRLGQLTGDGALEGIVPPHFSVPWTVIAARDGHAGARAWLATQAAEGLRPAQEAYALMLLEEGDASADALGFLEQAAEAGAPRAQHRLGLLYTTGDGVALDYVAAHAWLNIAATNGIAEAAKARDVVTRLMTPEQLTEAQTRAREFFETAEAPVHDSGRQEP